jgi:hypothetical protein
MIPADMPHSPPLVYLYSLLCWWRIFDGKFVVRHIKELQINVTNSPPSHVCHLSEDALDETVPIKPLWHERVKVLLGQDPNQQWLYKWPFSREIWMLLTKTQGETLIFWFTTNLQLPKQCFYSQKTLNLTAGKQGKLVLWDVSKALVKLGSSWAMMGRPWLRWMRGGDGWATNFVRSFVLSLSRENLVRTKDQINLYW